MSSTIGGSNGFWDIQWRTWRNGWHDLNTTSKQRSRSGTNRFLIYDFL